MANQKVVLSFSAVCTALCSLNEIMQYEIPLSSSSFAFPVIRFF